MRGSRPRFAAGYGIAADEAGLLEWADVERRLIDARNYWIATSGPAASPHVTPIWGVWLEGRLHFGTDRVSVKARNLATDPDVVIHLESGDDVVIVHGKVTTTEDDDAVAAAYREKYRLPDGFTLDPCLTVTPTTAFAWTERSFPTTATRWRFD